MKLLRALALTSLVACASSIRAQGTFDFYTAIRGSETRGSLITQTEGYGTLTLSGRTLSYDITVRLSRNFPVETHFHGPSVAGDIPIFSLVQPERVSEGVRYLGANELDPKWLPDIRSGKWYINLHNPEFDNAVISGYILPVPEPGTLALFALALGATLLRRRNSVALLCAAALSVEAAAPKLTPGAGRSTIQAAGEPGNVLSVEATDQLRTPRWDLLSEFVLTNRNASVNDPWCGGKSNRFYRITEKALPDLPYADNFRLTDHQGRSHELHYYRDATNINAFVLIFAVNGCTELTNRLAEIKALRDRFSSRGVVFWMVNSSPVDSRRLMADEATRLGIPFPVLHDRAQTVARLYNASSAGEVVAVTRESMQVLYRGAIDDREVNGSGTASRNYLEEALSTYLTTGSSPQVLAMKASGCEVTNNPPADIAYSTVIAPILQQKCVDCHSPGNVAPWSMTNHSVVQMYAPLIKAKVSSKEMPPWHADPEYGRFANDMSLSTLQEKQLIEWILAGAPRGAGPDPLENVPPPPSKWPVELGEPDLVLRTPLQTIRPSGVEPYRYIFVDTGVAEDKWLKAAIVRPSNTRVVHHYLVWEGRNMDQMASGLAGYVPGMQRTGFPEGTGVFLTGGSSLTFNLHYTPSGEDELDQPELALWFHKTPPPRQLITLPLANQNIRIPAGVGDHRVRADPPSFFSRLLVDTLIYGMAPHMHVRGKSMDFNVEYPDGRREVLLSVPKYDFHWQTRYRLAEPKLLPKGSRVWLTGSFDNSTLNMMNPDPTQSVTWGEQSWEEMFIGYFDATTVD